MIRVRYKLQLVVLLSVLAAPAWADVPSDHSRWAIIGAESVRVEGLSDLLTVQLSQLEGVQLVEREDAGNALSELKLNASGLADGNQAVRFGQLASADAIILVQEVAETSPALLRLRAMETRTGVRLLDHLLSRTDIESEVGEMVELLAGVRTKMRVGDADRRYVGVMGIRNEEPGSTIAPAAAALSAMFEHDLHQLTSVIALEREQIRRLTAERDLTGVELKLRASTTLVEGGLRRAGDGYRVSLSLVPLGGGKAANLVVRSETQDLVEVRRAVTAAVSDAIDVDPVKTKRVRREVEAALFSQRRDWLNAATRHAEASRMAEVALALDPSRPNHATASRTFNAAANQLNRLARSQRYNGHRKRDPALLDQSASNFLTALQTARRMHALEVDMIHKTPAGVDPERHWNVAFSFFNPQVETPAGGESPRHRQVRDELDSLRREKYRLLLGSRREFGRSVLPLLLARLDSAAYFADGPDSFAVSVPRFCRDVDAEMMASDLPPPVLNGLKQKYFEVLVNQTRQAREAISDRNSPHPLRGGDWSAEALATLWSTLARHENQLVRVCGLYGQMTLGDERAKEAALAAFELLCDLPDDAPVARRAHEIMAAAVEHLAGSGDMERVFEKAVQRAEQSGDIATLARFNVGVNAVLVKARPKVALQWCRRIETMMKDQTYQGIAKYRANILRAAVAYRLKSLARMGLTTAAPEPAQLPDAWSQFRVTTIPFTKPKGYGQMTGVNVRPNGDELLVAWRLTGADEGSIERLPLNGGTMKSVGPVIKFQGTGTTGLGWTCMIESGGNVFIKSSAPGLTVLSSRKSRFFGTQEGAPHTDIHEIAWLDGQLYLSLPNALARFDPQENTFDLIASVHAVRPSNPLDGGGRYFIRHLLADPQRKCLWLVLDDLPAGKRTGIWKYTPETKKFERIYTPGKGYTISNLTWRPGQAALTASEPSEGPTQLDDKPRATEDRIFFCAATTFRTLQVDGRLIENKRPSRWLLLDPESGETEQLEGYAPFLGVNARGLETAEFVMVADRIIGINGQLYTPDGQVSRLPHPHPWWELKPHPRGFIAANFSTSIEKIWLYEPRSLEPAPSEP